MTAISRSSKSHLPNVFFEPYLINIRCAMNLKYVIQPEVPELKSHFLGTVGVLNERVVLSLFLHINFGCRINSYNMS